MDARNLTLRAQLLAHYEAQGFVQVEGDAMGLPHAMLRPVRSESVGKRRKLNVFLAAHGYVIMPLLIEFVKAVGSGHVKM